MQSCLQDLATQWIQSYPYKTKTSQETRRSLQKFLEPNRKPKVIYTDNSQEFGKACEDISWNHCTSTPHRSETNGIAERAVRRVKERHLCRIVAIRSGWKLVGRFFGMLDLFAKRHRSVMWWENTIRETFLETISRTDHSIWFTGWVLPYLRKRPDKNPSIWKESLVVDCSSDTLCTRWWKFWKGDVLVAHLWGVGDEGRIGNLLGRFNAKEVRFPKENEKFFQSQMDESNFP